MSDHEHLKEDRDTREQLNEPAPTRTSQISSDPKLHIHDGLDNSDLRMLLDLATQQAKGKE